MRAITAMFKGDFGDKKDKLCHEIFKSFGGTFFNEGTYLPTMMRDVGYDVEDIVAPQLCAALKAAGFKVDSRPTPTEEEMQKNTATYKTLEGRTIMTMVDEEGELGLTEIEIVPHVKEMN